MQFYGKTLASMIQPSNTLDCVEPFIRCTRPEMALNDVNKNLETYEGKRLLRKRF